MLTRPFFQDPPLMGGREIPHFWTYYRYLNKSCSRSVKKTQVYTHTTIIVDNRLVHNKTNLPVVVHGTAFESVLWFTVIQFDRPRCVLLFWQYDLLVTGPLHGVQVHVIHGSGVTTIRMIKIKTVTKTRGANCN